MHYQRNSAATGVGGISGNDRYGIESSIVAGNLNNFGSSDISGSDFPDDIHNLIGGDPLLAPLGNYGGPTQTMALLPGSPALDKGDPYAMDDPGVLVTTDQRGVTRPSGEGATPDIGAFQGGYIPVISRLSFSVQPSNTTAGSILNPAIQVQVFDQYGNLLSVKTSDKISVKILKGPAQTFSQGSTTT